MNCSKFKNFPPSFSNDGDHELRYKVEAEHLTKFIKLRGARVVGNQGSLGSLCDIDACLTRVLRQDNMEAHKWIQTLTDMLVEFEKF